MSKKLLTSLEEALAKKTPEDIQKLFADLFPPDDTPKGWVDIEEHLPQMLAQDIGAGTRYKVKLSDGTEDYSLVGDHNVWYYEAKEAGVTHWWNE